MSQENVELVGQALEALKRRDRTTWLAVHDDDFEVVPIRDFPEPGVRGPEAAWDFNLKAGRGLGVDIRHAFRGWRSRASV